MDNVTRSQHARRMARRSAVRKAMATRDARSIRKAIRNARKARLLADARAFLATGHGAPRVARTFASSDIGAAHALAHAAYRFTNGGREAHRMANARFVAVANPLADSARSARATAYALTREATARREATASREHAARVARDYIGNAVTRERSAMWQAIADSIGARVPMPLDTVAIWQAVADVTTAPWFAPYARRLAYAASGEAFGRVTGDSARVETHLGDIVSDAGELAFGRMAGYVNGADNAVACDGTCNASHGGESKARATRTLASSPFNQAMLTAEREARVSERVPVVITLDDATVSGWHVTTSRACAECDACQAGKRCDNRVTGEAWMPVIRIVLASLMGAVRRPFKRDASQGVEWFSGTATEYGYGEIISAEVRANDGTVPASSAVPASAREVIALAAKAAQVAGADVIAANGQSSVPAGDALAVAMGYAPTDRGRRSARAALVGMAEDANGGQGMRNGKPRTLTLKGNARAMRTGTRNGARVTVASESVRAPWIDPRVSPRAM